MRYMYTCFDLQTKLQKISTLLDFALFLIASFVTEYNCVLKHITPLEQVSVRNIILP
jgi:hypothetical protein